MQLRGDTVEIKTFVEAVRLHCPKCGEAFGGFHEYRLSPRELQISDLVMRGFANCEIAGKLGCEEGTIKCHLTRIFAKVGIGGRGELMIIGLLGREALKQMREER
jgi:DNA-binding NarL/FixJ family response regulator